MANGFIYIMSNPSFADGKIKIGKSQKDPSFRREELNSTGVPELRALPWKKIHSITMS